MVSKNDRVLLTQVTDFETVVFQASHISNPFNTGGLRGLAIHIPITGWNTADVLFAIHHPAYSGIIQDSAGVLTRIESIVVGNWIVAPVDVWALGAATKAQLVSVTVGASTPVNQTLSLALIRLR